MFYQKFVLTVIHNPAYCIRMYYHGLYCHSVSCFGSVSIILVTFEPRDYSTEPPITQANMIYRIVRSEHFLVEVH